MKRQLHYLSLLILLSLCGCEVELHDNNYVDAEPLPLETPIEILLDAEQSSSGELLLVEGIDVNYRINTPESQLVSASFYIGDNLVSEKNTPQGSFQVYNNNLTGNVQVKCKITTKSLRQGESIRDQVYNGQTYEGEMSWPAHFVTPNLTFYQEPEETSLNDVTIHWTFNLEKYYFKVINNGEVIVEKTKETSITLPAPLFGSPYRYIEVRIVDEAGNELFPSLMKGYSYAGVDTFLNGGQLDRLYSLYSNILYTSQYAEVNSYNIPSLTKIAEFKETKSSAVPIAASPNSDKIAVDYSDQVYIFSGKDLNPIAKIDYPDNNNVPKDILLTSDNKLALYYNYLSKVYLYDADNGQLEKTISLSGTNFTPEDYPEPWNYQINESYLCEPVVTYGFYLTPLQNFEREKTVFYSQYYSSYFFHPTHPHELIIMSQNNKISILNCQSGEIIRTISKGDEYVFCNIDPATGNYLFQIPHYIIITDENGEELFRLKSEAIYPRLFNSTLTCWEGFALNIKPYLKKP